MRRNAIVLGSGQTEKWFVQMEKNALPHCDDSINTTGCCPKFNPQEWDGQDLHFDDKNFIRATTRSLMHIPINMGPVLARFRVALSRPVPLTPTIALS